MTYISANSIYGYAGTYTYIGSFVDRFNVVTKALEKMVDEFTGIPPPALLKNILNLYGIPPPALLKNIMYLHLRC